jgi:hypothetical protein
MKSTYVSATEAKPNLPALNSCVTWLWILTFALLLFVPLEPGAAAVTNVIYSTAFEASEGYTTNQDLAGQSGWLGSSGDGVVDNFFPGYGQQAYIGFSEPPGSTNDFFVVWHPLNVAPVPANEVLKFSVMMQITASSTNSPTSDDFRWSVYNTNGVRLFSVVFDNNSKLISYLLDDNNFVSADTSFDNFGYYDLTITMDFGHNLWSAALNDQVIVNSQAITTQGNALNLSDVDAVWGLAQAGHPGDNYMLFDNYSVTAESTSSIPARLQVLGTGTGGAFQLRLYGETGLSYTIEASSDLVHWQTVSTVTAPAAGAPVDVQDTASPTLPHRFYRAREGG